MKKIIFILLFMLLYLINIYSQSICFYYSQHTNLGYNSCYYYSRVFKKVFNENMEIKPLSEFDLYRNYDKIIIVSRGTYDGIHKDYWIDVNDYNNICKEDLYLYKDLVQLHANLLIIDACYAGYIFDYITNIPIIITSTYKANEWIPYIDEKYISSLAVALRCIFDEDYNCPIYCSNDVSLCQLSLIFYMFYKKIWFYQQKDAFYNWEFPSVGTCVVNGYPCRDFLHFYKRLN